MTIETNEFDAVAKELAYWNMRKELIAVRSYVQSVDGQKISVNMPTPNTQVSQQNDVITLEPVTKSFYRKKMKNNTIVDYINSPIAKHAKPKCYVGGKNGRIFLIGRSKIVQEFINANPTSTVSQIYKVFGSKYSPEAISRSISYIKKRAHKNPKFIAPVFEKPANSDIANIQDKTNSDKSPINSVYMELKNRQPHKFTLKEMHLLLPHYTHSQINNAISYNYINNWIKRTGEKSKYQYYYE